MTRKFRSLLPYAMLLLQSTTPSVSQTAEQPTAHHQGVASGELLTGKVGYIRLGTFVKSGAVQEMKQAIEKVSGANEVILDLRDNDGGIWGDAVEITNMFIDTGVLASMIDADGYRFSQMASNGAICTKPLVVLVNHGTGHASEMIAATMQDSERAKIVGEPTAGEEAVIRTTNKLEDGSEVPVTIARWLTPKNVDISHVGIKPDVMIPLSERDTRSGKGQWWLYSDKSKKNDIQLKRAIQCARSKQT